MTIFECDEEDGLAFLAMEFLDGEDLKTKISNRQWMPPGPTPQPGGARKTALVRPIRSLRTGC